MPEASVNETTLYYEEVGEGPPFIVLHGGLGYDHTYMQAELGSLSDAMRMIFVDQRGNGRSADVALESITIPKLAADVGAFADVLGLERFGLLGHSYGGFVALEYAVTHPDRLSQLILHSTSPGQFDATPQELAERADPSWITPAVRTALETFYNGIPENVDAFLDTVLPLYVRHERNVPKLRAVIEQIDLKRDVAAQSMKVLAGWSVESKLDRILCPTLVLCGRYDLLTTPECSRRLASRIPGAEIVWFEESGHFIAFDEPDAFAAAIRSWLQRH